MLEENFILCRQPPRRLMQERRRNPASVSRISQHRSKPAGPNSMHRLGTPCLRRMGHRRQSSTSLPMRSIKRSTTHTNDTLNYAIASACPVRGFDCTVPPAPECYAPMGKMEQLCCKLIPLT